MNDVIEFLERMGRDPQLRQGSQDEVELALASAEIAPEVQAAILAGDQARLESLLGQTPACGYLFPGKEGEGEEEEGGDDEETPSKEPDEAPERSGLRTVIPTA